MKPVALEDLIPECGQFYLRLTNKTYHLNPVSLRDEIWLKQTFGERLNDIYSKVQMPEICKIVFRIMRIEDKKDLAEKEVDFVDDNGLIETRKMGGVELLLSIISGQKEQIDIFHALLKSVGAGKIVSQLLEDQAEKKKVDLIASTGQKSSISSQVNMDGAPIKSSIAPTEKYSTDSKPSINGKSDR